MLHHQLQLSGASKLPTSPRLCGKGVHVAPARRNAALVSVHLGGGASSETQPPRPSWPAPLLAKAAAAAAGCLLLVGSPAHAQLSTVPPDQVTSLARPLEAQPVRKGRIWMLLVLGATALFGSTIVLESQEKFFPAISRANRAMDVNKKRPDEEEEPAETAAAAAQFEARLEAVEAERDEDARLTAAVLAGLGEAKAQRGLQPPAAAAAAASEGEGEGENGDAAASASGTQSEGDAAVASSSAAAAPRVPVFTISGDQIEQSAAAKQAEGGQEREEGGTS